MEDALIYATALQKGAEVQTDDPHFRGSQADNFSGKLTYIDENAINN
jgi:hypothetical protein